MTIESTTGDPNNTEPRFNAEALFEAIDVMPLGRALAEGTVPLHCSDEGRENYARIAAKVVSEPDHQAVVDLGDLMSTQLFGAISGNFVTTDDEGEEWVKFAWLPEPIRLTPGLIQHWQWLQTLARDPELAAQFLTTVPAELRDRIEADIAVRGQFAEIVAPLQDEAS